MTVKIDILELHALGDDDAYLIISKPDKSDEITMHVNGYLGDLLDMLEAAVAGLKPQVLADKKTLN